MSAISKTKPEGLLGLSVAEAKSLLLGIVCEEGGKVDMEKLALKYPYKNSASASTSYRNAKRKLLEIDAGGAADGSAPANSAASPGSATVPSSVAGTPKKRTPAKRKKVAPIDSDVVAGPADEATGSPKSKRQRKTPVKKETVFKSEEFVEEDDDEVKAESNVADSDATVRVKMEGANELAENSDVEPVGANVLLKYHTDGDDELGSIDLDAELDALDTPKVSVKGENDEA